jgi:hypothetical protein
MILTEEKPKNLEKNTHPSATLTTTNPTWTDPHLRGERHVTNSLRHGTASVQNLLCTYIKVGGMQRWDLFAVEQVSVKFWGSQWTGSLSCTCVHVSSEWKDGQQYSKVHVFWQ